MHFKVEKSKQLLLRVNFLAKKHAWTLFLVICFLLFWRIGVTRLDPDFGWHIRMGEYISHNKSIPTGDPFSYTMPSFRFVDHEWLTNIFIYQLWKSFGYSVLAMLFSASILCVFLIGIDSKRREFAGVVAVLVACVFFLRAGVRPQVWSWIFFAALFRVLWNYSLWMKYRKFLPLFMLLWANLHGSFGLGLFLIGWNLFWQMVQGRKVVKMDWIICVVSILVTLINPYGWRLWLEVWTQITDPNAKRWIMEWLPFYSRLELAHVVLVSLSVFVVIIFRKEMAWGKIATLGILLCMSIMSLRHVPLFGAALLVSLPELFQSFVDRLKQIPMGLSRFCKFQVIFTIVIVSVVASELALSFKDIVSSSAVSDFYPTEAISFLKKSNYTHNLFTDYGWGGYLIWKLPEKKVFIDGRMATWRWNVWPIKNETVPPTESAWVFEDYKKVVQNKSPEYVFKKFDIDTVMIRTQKRDPELETNIFSKLARIFNQNQLSNSSDSDIEEFLRQNNWFVVYEDSVATIYHYNHE